MKSYIRQIYEEGLGATLYKPINNFLANHLKGKFRIVVKKVFKTLYFFIALLVAFLIFYATFPLK